MTESKTAEEWASNFWSLNDQDEKTLALWFRCAQDQARREAIEKCARMLDLYEPDEGENLSTLIRALLEKK